MTRGSFHFRSVRPNSLYCILSLLSLTLASNRDKKPVLLCSIPWFCVMWNISLIINLFIAQHTCLVVSRLIEVAYLCDDRLCIGVIRKNTRAETRASLTYEYIVRFSWDFYEMILIGKFPSHEIGEKCTSRCLRITDIRQTTVLPSIPPYSAWCVNSGGRPIECSGDMAARGSGDAGHRWWQHLCNSELCCNSSWLAALPRAL